MKKTVCILGVVLVVTLLSGCEVTGPHVKLKPPVTVDDGHQDNDHHDRDGDFCPPGQAKKGRC
jgi:hypothetical protein